MIAIQRLVTVAEPILGHIELGRWPESDIARRAATSTRGVASLCGERSTERAHGIEPTWMCQSARAPAAGLPPKASLS